MTDNIRILLGDDDDFTLKTTSYILLSLGFERIDAVNNAHDALMIITAEQSNIDVVITDLNMPGMDGIDLLRAFEELNFQGNIILISGEDRQTINMSKRLAEVRSLTVIGALSKPLQRDDLASLLHSLPDNSWREDRQPSIKKIGEARLRKAIDAGEIKPWYQPKINIQDKSFTGVEALARWPESEYGPVYPDEFIPQAERYDLINNLTISLIRQIIADKKCWQQAGIRLKVAINISMASLQDLEFTNQIEQLIESLDEPYDDYELEVTESLLKADNASPLDALIRLRMKGLSLSIDDFGTGHSNLAQLNELPFDELKIDRSFIQSASEERGYVLLESCVSIARKLNMKIVAEGIETLKEWQMVERLGCDKVQGYLIARPMPCEQLIQWSDNWSSLSPSLFSHAVPDSIDDAEKVRLKALHSLQLLDTAPEERFDRLTRLAATILKTPISILTLVDEHRQWFKSATGISVSETPRHIAFCSHAIKENTPMIIEDASCDSRFAENPLVTHDPSIRFYAGVPLKHNNGQRLGTLCIIDTKPRKLTDSELTALVDLACIAQIELNRQ